MRDAIIAHVDRDRTAVGEVRGAADLHVRLGIEIFELGFNVVRARGIVVVAVTGEYSCASL